MKTDTATRVDIRAYVPGDEPAVLKLLSASLGSGPAGSRTPEFFRWKHFDNFFGPSYMLVAECDDRLVGFRSFMSWRFQVQGLTLRALRPVDTATHPDYQGRGIFSGLTETAIAAVRDETDVIFNTPNSASLPGYLKMGWEVVGRMPVWVRVRRPLRLITRLRTIRSSLDPSRARPVVNASRAAEVLESPEVASLLRRTPQDPGGITTPWSTDFLRWRYASAPLLDYRAVTDEREGELRGVAIFRVRPRGGLWETTISEFIVRSNDGPTVRRLLREVARSAHSDHITCRLPDGRVGRPSRYGLVAVPKGITLVARDFGHGSVADPMRIESWSLSLGDLEVF